MDFVNELITTYIPTWLLVLFSVCLAFFITYVSIPPIVKLAKTMGLYDLPNGRTSHLKATPYLGGVAVFTSIILTTVIIAGIMFSKDLVYIIAGLIILLFVGLKDDMLIINPKKKLIGQIIATAIIVVLGNIRIDNFQGVLGIHEISYFASISFTIFLFIVIINGINLIDGIDGLASGISIVISIAFGYWFFIAGLISYTILCFALAGSLIAFFYFNVFGKENKIFLGDAGSLIIGLTISVFTIQFLENQVGMIGNASVTSAPGVAFGILIIPLFDSLRVFLLRLMQGRSPFSADRQHLHHILLDLGFPHLYATLTLITVNLTFIVLSLALQELNNSLMLMTIQVFLASGLTFMATSILKRKRIKNLQRKMVSREIEQMNEILPYNVFEEGKKKSAKKSRTSFMKILNT